ncbi:C39 family peptidase [Persephonella sp.]
MTGRNFLINVMVFLSVFILPVYGTPSSNSNNVNTEIDKTKAKINLQIGSSFGRISIRPVVKPISEIKRKNLIKQKLDFSCGSAAVATIFNFYLGEKITEEQVINGLFAVGNVKKIIKRKGFSLLDIKKFAQAMGYKASGYRTTLEGLVSLNRPAIVTLIIGKYKHFVVFKGVYKGRVFIADPSLGNTILSAEEFKKMWYKNIALVIYSKDENKRFEITEEEKIWVDTHALRQSMYNQLVQSFRNFNEF